MGRRSQVSVIDGSVELPNAFDHPHASDMARHIAQNGMILRAQVGSGMHGTSVQDQDDRDEMGICLEPAEFVTGLAQVPSGFNTDSTLPFEQFQRHTVWDQPGGIENRSGTGDLDVVIYSARKWCRLALAGNPTVLLLLFVPDSEVVVRNGAGAELVANGERFISKAAGERFLGYLRSQRAAMTGETGAHSNRPELVGKYGYDTKFAMHALRLGIQGAQLLSEATITLPVPEPELSLLKSVRRGELTLPQVIDELDRAETNLKALIQRSTISAKPDRRWVNNWLHRSHMDYWAQTSD